MLVAVQQPFCTSFKTLIFSRGMMKSLKGGISKKGRSNKNRGRGPDLYFGPNIKVYTTRNYTLKKNVYQKQPLRALL